MNFLDLFKSSSETNPNKRLLKTRPTDDFADSVMLELKSIASDAIKYALEESEGKYMKSILDESYFMLNSLVITPKDREIAKRFDEFIITHESVDSNFRQHFFQQVLQREYRSVRGGTVRVPLDFSVTIQHGQTSLESMTQDEEFQISLKGRRIQFEAQASLTGPLKKETPSLQETSMFTEPALTATAAARHIAPPFVAGADLAIERQLQIKLVDANGASSHKLSLPATIGRDVQATDQKLIGWHTLQVSATYVSRQQLAIIELQGEYYFFVPEAATLTCMRSDGTTLKRLQLYKLPIQHREILNFGIDPNEPSHSPPVGPMSDYAIVEICVVERGPVTDLAGTPRPRAV